MRPFRPLAILTLFVPLLAPPPARAAFHLNEITQVLVGYDGDTQIQAVQLKSLATGENLVSGVSLNAYDGAGNLLGTGGTFTSNVANPASGAFILCATQKFQQTFGITADLTITNVLPVTNGQVSFEKPTCFINAIAYGLVTVYKNGQSAAGSLMADGATALLRTVDDATTPSCPLNEDAGAHFIITSGSVGHALTFRNNAGQSVSVVSTATGVDPSPLPLEARVVVTPNPARDRVRFSTRAPRPGRLRVYSTAGRLVWESAVTGPGARVIEWNGTDGRGGRAPTGVYLLEFRSGGAREHARFLLLR